MNRSSTFDFNTWSNFWIQRAVYCIAASSCLFQRFAPRSRFVNDDSFVWCRCPRLWIFSCSNQICLGPQLQVRRSLSRPIVRVFFPHSLSIFFWLLACHPRHQRRRSGRLTWKISFQSKTWLTSFGILMRTRLSPHMRLCWSLAGLMSEWNPTAWFWRKRSSCTWKWCRAQM